MKFLDRLLTIFDSRRRTMLGAVGQPNDLKGYLYAVRAQTYQKITGKSLPTVQLPSSGPSSDLKGNLSPSRRLSRRDMQ